MFICASCDKPGATLAKNPDFWAAQIPSHGGSNFEKLSNNSKEVWFIPLGHLLVYMSQLGSTFVKRTIKNTFFLGISHALCKEKVAKQVRCYPDMFLSIPHLEHLHEVLKMAPE